MRTVGADSASASRWSPAVGAAERRRILHVTVWARWTVGVLATGVEDGPSRRSRSVSVVEVGE